MFTASIAYGIDADDPSIGTATSAPPEIEDPLLQLPLWGSVGGQITSLGTFNVALFLSCAKGQSLPACITLEDGLRQVTPDEAEALTDFAASHNWGRSLKTRARGGESMDLRKALRLFTAAAAGNHRRASWKAGGAHRLLMSSALPPVEEHFPSTPPQPLPRPKVHVK